MYNLRYHIASLVAVFLALSVGLLLGTLVAERGMISDQAGQIVADLQTRFDEISAENDQLQSGLERDRAFAEAAVGPLVTGQLTGKTVAVLVGTGRVDGASAVIDAITRAGGSAFTVTIDKTALGLYESETLGLAGYFQLRSVEMATPGPELVTQVADAMADEWRGGGDWALTGLMVADGALSAESAASTATVDAVVALETAEPGAGADPFVSAFADAMAARGATVVAAEAAPKDDGVVDAFVGEGYSALDNAESPQGKVTLVWLLSGKAKGYFGSGPGSSAFFPPLGP